MHRPTLKLIAVATIATLTPSLAFAGNACDFYAGPNYTGEKFTLYKGHALQTEQGVAMDPALTGGSDFQLFTDPRWRGQVRSVRVQAGCTSDIYNGAESTKYTSDNPDTSSEGADGISYSCRCR